MADLLDESIKDKYRQYFVNDLLKFMKDAIDWNAFPYLLKDIYHNDTEEGGLCANNQFHTKSIYLFDFMCKAGSIMILYPCYVMSKTYVFRCPNPYYFLGF